ncbi:uncharacterized protein LOC143284141 [Babylonia areolata]|uniref:uncharacterized protein LOC143284141 n=1 Tax=Babylonia areolata TaxID=304850 RepID=UPI003FD2C06D
MAANGHMLSSDSESNSRSSDGQNFKFICSEEHCGKEFKRRDRLLIHLRTHTGDRPFKCEEPGCDKSYCRQPHLLRHQQNAHKPSMQRNSPVFLCEEDGCCREFTLEHNLHKHFRRQHSSEAAHKYKCEVEGCQETFRKHHQLRTHSYTHTSVNPYRCSHPGCLRTFQTTTRLRRHSKVHQGYQCDQEGCTLSFGKWTELRQHKSKDHLEEHRCEDCSKTFPKRYLLNNHLRSHHEEKSPLSCPYAECDRMYWDRRNLKAHIKRYHEEQRFSCEQQDCGKTFASKQKLNQHIKTHSPDYSPPVKTCKVKVKEPKKPGRKKASMASKLSGICDKEVQHDIDPVILESKDSDCTSALTSRHSNKDFENTAQRQTDLPGERVILETNWGTILKLTEIPRTSTSMPDSNTHPKSCSVLGDSACDETMELGFGVGSVKSCDFPSEACVYQTQKVITALPIVSDAESDTLECVTLTAL